MGDKLRDFEKGPRQIHGPHVLHNCKQWSRWMLRKHMPGSFMNDIWAMFGHWFLFNMLTWHTHTHYVQFLDASFCISIAFPCPPYAEIKNHMIQWPQPDSGFAPGLWISVNPPRDGQRHESTRGFPLYLGLGLGIFPRQLTVWLLVNQVRSGKEKKQQQKWQELTNSGHKNQNFKNKDKTCICGTPGHWNGTGFTTIASLPREDAYRNDHTCTSRIQ